ncbi:hotdog fold thioesterase [Saxibacter everestensis]|uniref:Hotdog fold thioesterase n=1 Tax=Saxibacter everestensis TaxID=2909229 RepID=A0ABY8R0Q5_9MICO|nr:hotdog fold thioesterase [Brevibacteriaceae bacterium ZFBP1038]
MAGHAEGTLVERMGIRFTEASRTRVVATMPVEGNTQPYGLLHGGAHLVLAETLGSMSAAYLAGPDHIVVGIEIGATHVRGVRSGLVTGTAEAIHVGRTLISHEIKMTDEEGKLLSTVRMTNLVRTKPPAAT